MHNGDSSFLKVILETVITFLILLLYTRLLGKKQMSHLTFFNYITGITIGSIAGNMVMIDTRTFYKELTSLTIWCVLTELVSFIALKSPKLRNKLDGEPTMVIKKGVIDKNALKSLRVNVDDLTMLLREKDIFDFSEVDYAILEPHGRLSVLKKDILTKGD